MSIHYLFHSLYDISVDFYAKLKIDLALCNFSETTYLPFINKRSHFVKPVNF